MFKDMNNKTLSIVFVGLLAVVLIVFSVGGDMKDRSFKGKLVDVPKEKINKITINLPAKESFTLVKNDDQWNVQQKDKTYPANGNMVDRTLNKMKQLKVNQIVATSEDKWEDYKVTDSLGTKVIINAGGDKEELTFGKLNFNRRTRSATTYLREGENTNVYGVSGMLKMSLSRGADSFYDKQMIDIKQPQNISKITYNYRNGKSKTLKKKNGGWRFNQTKVDSAAVASYLRSISNLRGSGFADVKKNQVKNPAVSLKIKGKDIQPAIKLKAGKANNQLVAYSSQKSEFVYTISKKTLEEKLRANKSTFLEQKGKKKKSPKGLKKARLPNR
jgi:hypothetical protein